MTTSTLFFRALALPVLLASSGCAGGLSQPFSSWKEQRAQVTMFRLQNYEPPVQTTNQGTNLLPPQVQQWMQVGAQLLPPGLLPQGLIPGSAPLAPQSQVARFHNFRILGWMTLNDVALQDEVYATFGKEAGFGAPSANGCMYAEFGFAFQSSPSAPSSDLLVSLSCNQVAPLGFTWPFGSKTGLTADTSKRVVSIAQTAFGG